MDDGVGRGAPVSVVDGAGSAVIPWLCAGSLADQVGRRPFHIGARIVAILFALPLYLLVTDCPRRGAGGLFASNAALLIRSYKSRADRADFKRIRCHIVEREVFDARTPDWEGANVMRISLLCGYARNQRETWRHIQRSRDRDL